MLGNPGSNPLELFWDTVDTLDQKLDAKIAVVEDVMKRWTPPYNEVSRDGDGDVKMSEAEKGFVVEVDTTVEQFLGALEQNVTDALRSLESVDMVEVFTEVCVCSDFSRGTQLVCGHLVEKSCGQEEGR